MNTMFQHVLPALCILWQTGLLVAESTVRPQVAHTEFGIEDTIRDLSPKSTSIVDNNLSQLLPRVLTGDRLRKRMQNSDHHTDASVPLMSGEERSDGGHTRLQRTEMYVKERFPSKKE